MIVAWGLPRTAAEGLAVRIADLCRGVVEAASPQGDCR